MAVAITSIVDSALTDFTAGGCYGDIAEDSNLTVTISTTQTLNPDSITNFSGYVDGSLTDLGGGNWSFEVTPESALDEVCIQVVEYTPEDCANVCPEITLTQTINGTSYSTDFNLVSDYTFNDVIINSVTHVGTSGTVTGTVAGDCITYSITLELLGENASTCTYNFDITLPACDTEITQTDCTTTDYCTVNTPTVNYVCDSGGTVTVTEDPGNEATVLGEELSWSNDGLTYQTFTSSFVTTEQTGYIKYVVDYDDGCAPQEVIITFTCTIDCDGTFEYNCTYLDSTNEFVATFTDNNTVPIQSDTIEYFVDGGSTGIPYTSGTLIDATGINRIDWKRTIVFNAPCPDEVIEFYCAKVDEDCNYTGYSLTAEYDINSDSVVPTFTGDETNLDVSEKTYSVDGSSFSAWLGGAIPTNNFATFVWRIQKIGCEPVCLIATAARSQCDNPINVVVDTTSNPIDIDITNTNPIDINIDNDVTVIGDFCCDETTGGDSGPCADGTCGATLSIDSNCFISWDDTLCENDFLLQVLQYDDSGTWINVSTSTPYLAAYTGSYRLVGSNVSCADVILDTLDNCCAVVSHNSGLGGYGIVFDNTYTSAQNLNIKLGSATPGLSTSDRFKVELNGILILDTGYYYDTYQASSCPETNGYPIVDLSSYSTGQDVGAAMVANPNSLVVTKNPTSGELEFDLSVLASDQLRITHNDVNCDSQVNWNITIRC